MTAAIRIARMMNIERYFTKKLLLSSSYSSFLSVERSFFLMSDIVKIFPLVSSAELTLTRMRLKERSANINGLVRIYNLSILNEFVFLKFN